MHESILWLKKINIGSYMNAESLNSWVTFKLNSDLRKYRELFLTSQILPSFKYVYCIKKNKSINQCQSS